MLNGHGDDLYLFEGKIKHNFSSNVYYRGCSDILLNILRNKVDVIENYPSPIAQELNDLAAKKFGLDPSQFLFTNGATEAFYLIAQNYRSKTATIVSPTFSEYEDACRINEVELSFIQREQINDTELNTDIIFICNPNNPDGKVMTVQQIETLLVKYPKTIFIIDEAYIEFSKVAESSSFLINQFNNIVIVKSLTKTFAIPGLRLGYIIGNSDFVTKLLELKMPWSVNAMAIEVGKCIFENYEELSFDANQLIKETELLKEKIKTIDWLEIIEGHATYFLIKLNNKRAADLKSFLIQEHGILIRDATNFTGLEGECVRVALQSEEANSALAEALNQWE